MLQPRFMNSTASQSSSSGCVGGFAHLPEVLERGDDAAAEMLLPETIDDDARGQRILRRADPSGQRQAAAGGAAVGPRNLGRRSAVGDHFDEARLHLRTVALDVATNQEVRGRHLVAARTLVEVAARERRRNAALRAADDLVALAERREPVVAVGDDFRHRQRAGPLFLERRDLRRRAPACWRARPASAPGRSARPEH